MERQDSTASTSSNTSKHSTSGRRNNTSSTSSSSSTHFLKPTTSAIRRASSPSLSFLDPSLPVIKGGGQRRASLSDSTRSLSSFAGLVAPINESAEEEEEEEITTATGTATALPLSSSNSDRGESAVTPSTSSSDNNLPPALPPSSSSSSLPPPPPPPSSALLPFSTTSTMSSSSSFPTVPPPPLPQLDEAIHDRSSVLSSKLEEATAELDNLQEVIKRSKASREGAGSPFRKLFGSSMRTRFGSDDPLGFASSTEDGGKSSSRVGSMSWMEENNRRLTEAVTQQSQSLYNRSTTLAEVSSPERHPNRGPATEYLIEMAGSKEGERYRERERERSSRRGGGLGGILSEGGGGPLSPDRFFTSMGSLLGGGGGGNSHSSGGNMGLGGSGGIGVGGGGGVGSYHPSSSLNLGGTGGGGILGSYLHHHSSLNLGGTGGGEGLGSYPPPHHRSSMDLAADSMGRASSILILTQRLQQQQIDIARLTEENSQLRRQIDSHVSWNAQHRDEFNKLRKEEIDTKQKEAKLIAQVTRLEAQIIDMKTDMDKLVKGQTDVLDKVESLEEQLETKQEQLDDAKSRAEEAEFKLNRVMDEQRAIIQAATAKEREHQLNRFLNFEGKLVTALARFKEAREEVEQLTLAAEEQRQELDTARSEFMSSYQELERKREAIRILQEHNREVAERYAIVVDQQTEEISILKANLLDADANKIKIRDMQEKIVQLKDEVDRRGNLQEQCVSMLKVVEEQQAMIFAFKDKQQHLQDEVQKMLIHEADWKSKARNWSREKAALEKEIRELRYQLKRALSDR